jgi:DNA ligase (NAD+)
MRELADLEARHPESIRIPRRRPRACGGRPAEGFETVEHLSPMLSLDKRLQRDELREFMAGCAEG